MRNKLLLFSMLAGVAAVVAVAALGAAFFVLSDTAPVQAEEATLEVAPVQQVEPVSYQKEKPVHNFERVDYAKKQGGCSYESVKQPMVEAPVQQPNVADEALLTLAETE